MFSWFRRWWQDVDRAIFVYWDGSRTRRIDPWVAYCGVKDHPEYNMESDPLLVDMFDWDARNRMIKACCDVFDVKVYDGEKRTGLTQQEILELMVAFGQFCKEVKKNINDLQTGQQPTESTEALVTSNSLDSTSMPGGLNSDDPLPS